MKHLDIIIRHTHLEAVRKFIPKTARYVIDVEELGSKFFAGLQINFQSLSDLKKFQSDTKDYCIA